MEAIETSIHDIHKLESGKIIGYDPCLSCVSYCGHCDYDNGCTWDVNVHEDLCEGDFMTTKCKNTC
jgi:hypothetical protein